MIAFLITRGESFDDGWTKFWFTKGASLLDNTLVEADLVSMFFPKARVVVVPGDPRGQAVEDAPTVWKYPKDLYDVSVDWQDKKVLPILAQPLSSVEITVTDPTLGSPSEVPSLVAGSGVDGQVSYAIMQNGVVGKTYTIRHRVTFANGNVLDKYVKLEIRNPRSAPAPIFKFPNDAFPVPVKWTGRMPRQASALGALAVLAYDSGDLDVTSTYVQSGQVVGPFSVGNIFGGTGGEQILIEFGQDFSDGRKFNTYALLTVEVPPP